MGFLDKIKGAAKYVKDKVVQAFKPQHDDDNTPPPAPDTSRYLHVSVPLIPIENPLLRKMLGRDYMCGPGQTRNVGNNAMKAAADAMGANNKERRRLRTKIKRRAAELRAGAPLNPSVRSALAGAQ
ncbi:hypothetical protein IVIADoCa2_13 [Xanthomonas phage vB_Xar_IVIA-DoCa2]|uniref:Uncharacterized protein n=1 Tax=Xanthomonas phage vB_Xar_IVIA-DoCa2 TaxID=2970491 RepID=A0A976XI30_9CAUD|nr:hypothetical protein IVIADoCa2_13 [Xanthomonas phage vB_Xar_IVIA-DoCa2]